MKKLNLLLRTPFNWFTSTKVAKFKKGVNVITKLRNLPILFFLPLFLSAQLKPNGHLLTLCKAI